MLDRRSLMTLAAAGMVLSEKAVAQAGASPHVATIQEIYAAFGRGDMDAMLERLAPLIEWDYGTVCEGAAAKCRAFSRSWFTNSSS